MTYQPSDARTSSPLASVQNALGRCGEESTFCVAALRSVGIPARQVYTPRWAHTDDNHAWVEAWADGEWHFIGACEPEPVLDLGWFNAPASRAMLMHTKVFGRYDGPEEVVLESPNYTEINLIDNYATTARADFRVVDSVGKPVEGARVDFCIYNYAEFYPAVSKYTDADGRTFLSSGLGDLLVWASKDGAYGYAKCSFGKDKEVTVTLGQVPEKDAFDIVPPPENVRLRQSTLHGILMHAVGQRDAEQGVRPHLHLGRDALWRLHLLEQVAVRLIMDVLNVVFVVQQRHVVQIVRRAAAHLRRNVGHLHVIHLGNEHHEGHG